MNNMVTLEDLRTYQTELEAEFGSGKTVAYANVSMGQLSIARLFGGAAVQGHLCVYNPVDDSLIREDVVKWVVDRKTHSKTNKDTSHASRCYHQTNFLPSVSDLPERS